MRKFTSKTHVPSTKTSETPALLTLFMSDEEKHGHHFDLPLFFNITMQFLAPSWGFEC